METVLAIWDFFLKTQEWYWGLWQGWFGFFKGLVPAYLSLGLSTQLFICFLYLGTGYTFVAQGGKDVAYPNPSQNRKVAWLQHSLYKLYLAIVFPGILIFAFMLAIPFYPTVIFYGLWLTVWMGVAILALLYCVYIWPFTLIF